MALEKSDLAAVGAADRPSFRRFGIMEIPREYLGWWRILTTSQWVDDYLDDLGPAVISLTGYGDRLRMHMLLAYVSCRPTKSGVS